MYCRAAQTEEKGGGWNKLAQETVKKANHEMHDELNINQWRIQGRGPGACPPLFFDQNEARGAEKNFFGDCPPPPLSQPLDDRPPLLSEGLDSPLIFFGFHWLLESTELQ